jgi:hypothetical protein
VTAPADPRIKALRRFALSITVFNLLGHTVLGFEQSWLTPLVGIGTAYVVELLLETLDARLSGRPERWRGSAVDLVNFLLPAHIGGLACAMLLYGNERLWPTAFAATVATASKYLIRVRPVTGGPTHHVLNPSNFGIAVTLVFFGSVGIAPPYQFTANVTGVWDWVVPVAIGVAGTMLNAKLTRRGALIVGWLGGFVAQAAVRAVVFDHAFVAALLPMTGVAFVLFTNYMITDPGTTPRTPWRQAGFGAAVAAVYGVLVLLHVTFGLFFALVLVCIGRWALIVASRWWRAHRGTAVPAATRQPARPEAAPAPTATAGV